MLLVKKYKALQITQSAKKSDSNVAFDQEFIMMDNQFGVSSPGLDILSYSDSVSYVNIVCNRYNIIII